MILLTVFFSHLQIIEEKGHTLPIWMRPIGAPPKNPRIHVELAEKVGIRFIWVSFCRAGKMAV